MKIIYAIDNGMNNDAGGYLLVWNHIQPLSLKNDSNFNTRTDYSTLYALDMESDLRKYTAVSNNFPSGKRAIFFQKRVSINLRERRLSVQIR